jgi:hypothetical protein
MQASGQTVRQTCQQAGSNAQKGNISTLRKGIIVLKKVKKSDAE